MKTFFDAAFDPGIMLGPVALDYLHDHFIRHNRSLDAVTTILQVLLYLTGDIGRIDLLAVGIHEAH